MKNKMITTLLMVMIAVSVSLTCNVNKVYAETGDNTIVSNISQLPSLNSKQPGYSLLEQEILKNISKESESFSIECKSDGLGVTDTDKVIKDVINRLVATQPSGMWNLHTYALESRLVSSGNIEIIIIPKYRLTTDMKKDLDSRLGEILHKIIKDKMSTEDKELAIHDWIINNTQYDETYTIYDPYNTLLKHTGVCAGYALLAQRMFTLSGIESILITGDTGSKDGVMHEWNMVHIDGRWYHVDCTWDDPTYKEDDTTNKYKREYRKYKYYNESDKFMQKSRTWDDTVYPHTN